LEEVTGDFQAEAGRTASDEDGFHAQLLAVVGEQGKA
jgi:hypothetical protein